MYLVRCQINAKTSTSHMLCTLPTGEQNVHNTNCVCSERKHSPHRFVCKRIVISVYYIPTPPPRQSAFILYHYHLGHLHAMLSFSAFPFFLSFTILFLLCSTSFSYQHQPTHNKSVQQQVHVVYAPRTNPAYLHANKTRIHPDR